MRYARATLQRAAEEMDRRRRNAQAEAEKRRSCLFAQCPEAAQLYRKITSTSSRFAAVLALRDKEKIRREVEALKNENLHWQKQLENLLTQQNLPQDYLDVRYTCPICRDTGSHDGQMCACFEHLLRQTAFRELCESSPLEVCSFDEFDLRYYPDDEDWERLIFPLPLPPRSSTRASAWFTAPVPIWSPGWNGKNSAKAMRIPKTRFWRAIF